MDALQQRLGTECLSLEHARDAEGEAGGTTTKKSESPVSCDAVNLASWNGYAGCRVRIGHIVERPGQRQLDAGLWIELQSSRFLAFRRFGIPEDSVGIDI
ncbi:MAG: hypothetical protein F4Y95_06565 [Chloroflexi bacterium]|nr:hypothetical protein [Chloroflexota bacterium]